MSLSNNAKEELDIVYSPFAYLVNEHSENTISFKELFNIEKVKILVQNPSYIFCAYETQKGSNSVLSISSKANNNNPIYRYIQSIYRLKTELEAKEIKNIGIRMVNVPITQSMIIVDPNEERNNNLNSEMYIEPCLFPIKEEYHHHHHHQ